MTVMHKVYIEWEHWFDHEGSVAYKEIAIL